MPFLIGRAAHTSSDLHLISQTIQRKLGKSRIQPSRLGRSIKAPLPATSEAVDACEKALGLQLPPVLREIYLNVANGGFGPGYGIIGIEGGFADGRGTLVPLCQEFKSLEKNEPTWRWTSTWLPFCHWGCGIYSVVNCVAPYPVFYLDSDAKDENASMKSVIFPHKESLTTWLEDWLAGKNLWADVWR